MSVLNNTLCLFENLVMLREDDLFLTSACILSNYSHHPKYHFRVNYVTVSMLAYHLAAVCLKIFHRPVSSCQTDTAPPPRPPAHCQSCRFQAALSGPSVPPVIQDLQAPRCLDSIWRIVVVPAQGQKTKNLNIVNIV